MSANYFKPRTNKPKSGKNLVLARAGLFYGLKYYPIKEEKNSINRGITSTPNFIFYDSNTKVIIDFSDFKNTNTKEELESFWKLVQSGMTFTITNGKIYNAATSSSYDVSGTYVFRKLENLTIHADVTSATELSTKINLYSKFEFETTPSFEFSYIITPTNVEKKTKIYNTFGANSKNSFTFFGASIGDYIQLQNFNIRYKILEFSIDSEGKEIITIEGLLPEEDRLSTKTYVALYIEKQNTKDIIINPTDEKIGSCSVIKNGLILSCYNNQTESQCSCKSADMEESLFTENGTCTTTETSQTELTSTDILTNIAENLVNIIDKKQTIFNTSNMSGNISPFSNPLSVSSYKIN
jgi:predicted heme/steroid binding protein